MRRSLVFNLRDGLGSWGVLLGCAVLLAGCGTTRMSDTMRTGTEQLLLSTAIDRAISSMDFSPLAGRDVYFDPQYLRGASDEGYIISSIRQRLLASGVFLKASREEATYVVEARAGAIGTNRQDVLLGVPQMSLPTMSGVTGIPSGIPEIPLAKSTYQKGVAKLAVFAYNQVSGQPVWQSGSVPIAADSRDSWFLGTGPFQRGTIYDGTSFAGQRVMLPFGKSKPEPAFVTTGIPVTSQATFNEQPGIVPPGPPTEFTQRMLAQRGSGSVFAPGVPPSQTQAPRMAQPNATTPAAAAPQVFSGLPAASTGFSGASSNNPASNSPSSNSASGGNAAAGLLLFGNEPRSR